MKKAKLMVALNVFLIGALTFPAVAASPKLMMIAPETAENQSPYADSIRIRFDQNMKASLPDGRIRSSINIPQAPAGYENVSNSVYISAKNYTIKIIPELVGRTQAYEGSWFDLGGTAVFDPYDPTGKTVLLVLKDKSRDIFKPGDRIRITVSSTVTNAAQETVHEQNRILEGVAN